MKHRTSLLVLIIGFVLTIFFLFEAGSSPRAFAKTQSLPSPLPLTCSGPSVCAYGYVYFDGAPVPTATVKFDGLYGTLTVTTTTGGLSAFPYYQANLSGAPLLAAPGDVLTVTATYEGSSEVITYSVAP